jgi:ubiquinone/menaquinone biosynthesis C-methylase UbiE
MIASREPELMDKPQPISVELRETLRELEFLNRYFGGHRFLRRFMKAHFPRGSRKTYRILDLGTGGGDFPRVIVDWARKGRVNVKVDAVDTNSAIVDLAVRFSRSYPEISYQQGDALNFDSGHDRCYDLVHCSLSLHHFDEEHAVALLRHMRELSKGYVLITDLEHGRFTTLAVALVNRLLGHQRMTIKDGDTSARRAFSFDEVNSLALRAGWTDFEHERFLFCRQALWMFR